MESTQPRGTKESRDVAAFRRQLRSGRSGPLSHVLLLGLRTFATMELLEKIQAGLAFSALEHFQRNLDLPMTDLAELVQIRPRTLTRRKEQGRLRPDESDRLLRAARIFGKALELFEGDAEAARSWLSAPQPALGGAIPLDLARTELGAREVENLIGRLEHGVFS